MIKEFWQEQREEKKRLKQLKKQNKKIPKTKEQIAYKIFGILFFLFLVFGSIGYTCRGSGDPIDFDWSQTYGVTKEMEEALSKSVSINELVPSGIINDDDFLDCAQVFSLVGITIENEGQLSETLLSDENNLTKSVTLSDREAGGLIKRVLLDLLDDDVTLLDFDLYLSGQECYLKSVVVLDLSQILTGTKLPIAYITTTSTVSIHDKKIVSLYPDYKINQIEEKLNDSIVDLINSNQLVDLSYYTNSLVCNAINYFGTLINAEIGLSDNTLSYLSK